MAKKQTTRWLGQALELAAPQRMVETDVIVCGGGLAGVAAVRAAAENGARVILFEKCPTVQGRSGQFAVMDGKLLRHWNVDVSHLRQDAIESLWKASGGYAKKEIIEYAVMNAGRDFDWYLEGLPKDGVYFSPTAAAAAPAGTKLQVTLMRYPFNENYDPKEEAEPVYPATIMMGPSHVGVLKENLELAKRTGRVEALFNTPVKKLIREAETGRITGVLAEDGGGAVIEAHAKRAVILATGDFTGDPELLKAYFPDYVENPRIPCGMDINKKPANTGDGHRMGIWVGAKMEEVPPAVNCHNMGGAMGVTPYLMLDIQGNRFMNEDVSGASVERKLHTLPEARAWQIFDSDWPAQIAYMPHGHGACSHIAPEGPDQNAHLSPMDSFASQRNIDAAVQKGSTVKADTLEELVEKMGLPAENALRSIARYNALARAGEDLDFGKKASRMFPLVQGPFYGSRIEKAPLLCCHMGLDSDENGRCLDENGVVIPGLYAAGNVQGGRFAIDYPTVLPGLSHSMALSYGRRVGTLAARNP